MTVAKINILKTRSFWATMGMAASAVAQMPPEGGDMSALAGAISGILEVTGVVPDGAAAAQAIGPLLTAGLGAWAYVERLRGKRKVVLGSEK